MGSQLKYLAVLAITVAALLHSTAAQETHVVGDKFGWLVPPGGHYAYEVWAASHDFSVGDTLDFNFTTGEQDVAMVTKEAFESCNSTNPIELKTTGPANFTLNTTGEFYFIGTMDKHCELGQKLAINVTEHSASPTPNPSPKPSPTPRGPVTYVVGDHFGWIVPPGGELAYSTWAYGKTFYVGDTLEFNFTTGEQDVAMVSRDDYEDCDLDDQHTLKTAGPAYFKLNTTGWYYFIGTMDKHCKLGQKLAIYVAANPSGHSASPTPNPSPKPSPTPRGPVTYVVGDQLGWIVPPGGELAYSSWAYGKTFYVGDTLEFNFTTGEQNVAMVTKEDFEDCDSDLDDQITLKTAGPAYFKLNTTGWYYFIGTMDKHCKLGQKLAIYVAVNSGGPSASPYHTPAPAPTPSTPYSQGPSGAAASSPSSSAPSMINNGGYFLTTLLVAVAFFN